MEGLDSCDCSEVIVSASGQNSWVDFAEESASGISLIPFSFPYVLGCTMQNMSFLTIHAVAVPSCLQLLYIISPETFPKREFFFGL